MDDDDTNNYDLYHLASQSISSSIDNKIHFELAPTLPL